MTDNLESIILGGGCFWCTEEIYKEIKGVESVTPGYSGGSTPNPNYDAVCEGDTGHAEVIKVEFDPNVISLDQLLDVFWDIHDPTSLNKQGNDVGTEYRSIVLYLNDDQKQKVENSINTLNNSQELNKPVVTEVKKLEKFYPAEDYHKDYFSKNPLLPYCSLVISPKIKHFKEKYHNFLKEE